MKIGRTKTEPIAAAALVVCFALVALLFFSRAAGSFFYAGYVSFNLEYYRTHFGLAAANGLLPYRDVPVEYPPLSAAWLWALAPFARSTASYLGAFSVGMTAFAFIALAGVMRIASLLKDDDNGKRDAAVCAVFTAGMIAVGPVGVVSLDYIPVALTAWAVYFLFRERGAVAYALLGAGVAAKGYPAVLFPLFCLYSWRTGRKPALIRGAAVFGAVCVLLYGIPFMLAPKGIASSFAFHAGRGVEKISVYGAALSIMHFLGARTPLARDVICWRPGEGAATDAAMRASTYVLAGLLVSAYARIFHTAAKFRGMFTKEREIGIVLSGCALLLTAFILGFKIASPQFLCWLLPFVAPLAAARPKQLALMVPLAAAGLCAQWIFPWHFQALTHGLSPSVTIVNVVKIAALATLFVMLWRLAGGDPAAQAAVIREHPE